MRQIVIVLICFCISARIEQDIQLLVVQSILPVMQLMLMVVQLMLLVVQLMCVSVRIKLTQSS